MGDLKRACVMVLDSVGIGEMPDAAAFGDTGSDTLGHIANTVGGLHLPHLAALGLGNIARSTPLKGVAPVAAPLGSCGKMAERSHGKDTTTGHWEMAGYLLPAPFSYFPNGFPPDILEPWRKAIGVGGVLGNKAASGTVILDELGLEHLRTGWPIVYTSADSVFQVAAHEEVVPPPTLYRWCQEARRILDARNVARVIARPFVGKPGAFVRTYNRHDFSVVPGETVLDQLKAAGKTVVGVGKIPDIYANRGITLDVHTQGNAHGILKTLEVLKTVDHGLVFVNLVDFDMLYGHRRDPRGYYQALQEFDAALPSVMAAMGDGDLLMLTADHGNDPTFPGSDHTREYVPLLCYSPSKKVGQDLGTCTSFAHVGQTLREGFGLPIALPVGESLLRKVM